MERRLGRGLSSLLGQTEEVGAQKTGVELPIDRIQPNPWQPRQSFDAVALEELTESVRRHGVLQPIVVRGVGGGYQVVSGERRLRAARAAGLQAIPAVVRADISDEQMLELALVENVQRQDLDALERAQGYRQLMEALNVTQERVAEMVGLKRSTVANHLRLLDLPPHAQTALRRGLISMGHARALLGLGDATRITGLVEQVARHDLSVREVEKRVRQLQRMPAEPVVVLRPPGGSPAWVRGLEERMRTHLGTRVTVKNRPGHRGQIVIDYFSRADLDRLCEILAPREEV